MVVSIMKFILYLSGDCQTCVGEVPVGKTSEQVCKELKGTWIDFGERRHFRTQEEAEDALLGWAVSSGGFIGKGDPISIR
jgi:hypothetical protein